MKKIVIDEALYLTYYNKNLSNLEISKITGFSYSALNRIRKSLNLTAFTNKGKSMDKQYKPIVLSYEQRQVLIGGLLGDASIELDSKTKAKNARLRLGHGSNQIEYMLYKMTYFNEFGPGKLRIRADGAGEIKTKSNPVFTYFRQKFYPNGKKVIPLDLLNEIGGLGLAILYMDDGYYDVTTNSISIALCGFTQKDQILFQKFLLDKFNIDSTLQVTNAKYTKVYIRAKSRDTFFSLVTPYMHKSMLYKLCKHRGDVSA